MSSEMPKKDGDSSKLIKSDRDSSVQKAQMFRAVSKWQKASVRLTQVKIDLENLLEAFDVNERRDERYQELVNTVEFMFNNIKDHYDPQEKKKTLPDWMSVKNALIGLGAAVIILIGNNLEKITTFIYNIFKGTP
jgi:hypothetical protein